VKLICDFDHRGTKEWFIRPPRPDVDESRCDPEGYTLGQWQLDASGMWRSSGNTLLAPEEIARLEVAGAHRRWKAHTAAHGYDHQHHVALGDALRSVGKLRPDFAVIPAHSNHPSALTDIVRMRSLNTIQAQQGRVRHLCPLPLDILRRVIKQRSMPDDLVLDPFVGIGSAAYVAVKEGRRGYGIELNEQYWRDGVDHCTAAERKASVPTLFDLAALDAAHRAAEPHAEAAE
jgi:hypothetical protein